MAPRRSTTQADTARDLRAIPCTSFLPTPSRQHPQTHMSDATEERWRIIGLAEGVLIFVVYTEREIEGEQIIRLISARQPTRTERKRYEEES